MAIMSTVSPIFYSSYNLALLCNGFGDHKIFDCLIIEQVTSTKTIPVGHGIFYFTFSTWSGKQLYLEDMYVMPDHRSELVCNIMFCIE